MRHFNVKLFCGCALLLLNSGCTMIQHGDDPNYTYCKTLENKIFFNSNTTTYSTNPVSTYSQTAASETNEDQQKASEAYERLNCSRYQALKF